MTYIDAELLREKIAEQMESLPREVGRGAGTITSKGYGMMQAFQIMCSIIDSLQEEHPEVDLEKGEQPKIDWESEIEEYWIATGWSKNISLGKFKVIARYFIGLALEAPEGMYKTE